jgi:hypothetical protein
MNDAVFVGRQTAHFHRKAILEVFVVGRGRFVVGTERGYVIE